MSSAPRVAKHRARMKARAELLTLLLQDTAVRARAISLIDATPQLASALANDPLLLANALQQAELTRHVTPQVGAAPLPPPHTPLPSPHRGEDKLSLLPTAAMAVPASAGRQRPPDECFERMVDGLYPGLKGDHSKLDRDARGQVNKYLAQIRAKMDEQGIPTDRRPAAIDYAISRLPNYARNRTPGTLAKHWTNCIAGADRNGRDNGVVLTRYVNETGTVKHQPKLNLE